MVVADVEAPPSPRNPNPNLPGASGRFGFKEDEKGEIPRENTEGDVVRFLFLLLLRPQLNYLVH